VGEYLRELFVVELRHREARRVEKVEVVGGRSYDPVGYAISSGARENRNVVEELESVNVDFSALVPTVGCAVRAARPCGLPDRRRRGRRWRRQECRGG
jgi:hypothetical protein